MTWEKERKEKEKKRKEMYFFFFTFYCYWGLVEGEQETNKQANKKGTIIQKEFYSLWRQLHDHTIPRGRFFVVTKILKL